MAGLWHKGNGAQQVVSDISDPVAYSVRYIKGGPHVYEDVALLNHKSSIISMCDYQLWGLSLTSDKQWVGNLSLYLLQPTQCVQELLEDYGKYWYLTACLMIENMACIHEE